MTEYLPYNAENLTMDDFKSLPAEMQDKITDNWGVLTEIINAGKIKVKCAKNHTLRTQLIKTFINDNKWCSSCDQTKYNISDLISCAAKNNGLCLSTEYLSCHNYYTWQCGSCDHIWKSTWISINCKKSWCPNCSNSSMETICRLAIEEITKLKFPKNLDVIGAEIDCYNDDLKLGFEYDGIQHHKYVQYFHGNEDSGKFEQQLDRDMTKDELCIDAGIQLIRIDYTINKNKLRSYIHDLIRGLNLDIELETNFISDNEFNAIVAKTRSTKSERYITMAANILESKQHKIVSTSCCSRTSDLIVICDGGHTYVTNIDKISQDGGCPTCSGKDKLTIERIKQVIESKGYTFIAHYTKDAINASKEDRIYHCVKFNCNNPDTPHINDMLWDNIKRPDKICSECSKINIAQKQAEIREINIAKKIADSPKTKFYNDAKSIGYEINMDTYDRKDEPVKVTCIKNCHTFAMLTRTFRFDDSNLEYCSQCIFENDFPNLTVLDNINYLEYNAGRKISVKCICGHNDIISEVCLRTRNKCCKDKKCRFNKCATLDRNKDKLHESHKIPKTIENMEAEVVKCNELAKKSKIEHKQSLANEYVQYDEYMIPGGDYSERLYVKFICKKKHEFMCRKYTFKKNPDYEFCTQCIIEDDFTFLSYAEKFDFLDPKLENKNIKLICQCTPNQTFTWTNKTIRKRTSACNLEKCTFKTDPKYHRSIIKKVVQKSESTPQNSAAI